MVFNSLEFLLFFSIVLSAHTVTSRGRWILLLAASYYFYSCWRWEYLPLLVATSLLNYACARIIAAGINERIRKHCLNVSLFGSLGVLFIYKYFNFLADLANNIYAQFGIPRPIPYLHVALPIGISFYTFQALSYTIDVYNDKIKPERHIGFFCLFIVFFPQLVAGPIEKAENLLPQLKKAQPFDYEKFVSGLQIALWGFFKKVVIADRLALYVDTVYGKAGWFPGLPLIVATYFFAIQIYCDFSGYSEIAIGCARMMGYDLMKNFERPYFSSSIPEFWRRWHISLMRWFRDYLYIPLGGSRRGENRKYFNQFVVFLVSGLWHGADITFVLWGIYHGCLHVLSNLTLPLRRWLFDSLGVSPKLIRILGVFITFNLVSFGWIFFRADNVRIAAFIIRNLTRNITNVSSVLRPVGSHEFMLALISIGLLVTVEFAQRYTKVVDFVQQGSILVRYPLYIALVLCLLLLGVFKEAPFLYFQF